MPRRLGMLYVATILLACGGATCLYSGAGAMAPGAPGYSTAWNPVLAFVAGLLTIPISTPGIADIRDIVLPAALSVVCVLLMLARSQRPATGSGSAPGDAAPFDAASVWLMWSCGGVAAMALASALVNGSMEWSFGWIARFLAGSAWAVLLARAVPADSLRKLFGGLLAMGVLALGLSIGHRADRGMAHFSWPIGPITPTAALATTWSAMAGAAALSLLAVRSRRAWSFPFAGVLAVALYALAEAGRRGPVLALAAALLSSAGMLALSRLRSRAARLGVFVLAGMVLVAGGGYVYQQMRSENREASWSVLVRLGYWRQCVELIRERPLLGTGPDTTVLHLTNRVAPLRAESPWLYEGNFDPTAHNEWLQAIVELGVPAGILYLAIPCGIAVVAARRILSSNSPTDAAWIILGLFSAVICVVTLELSSITLRGPIMSVWYWTILGMLAAACRPAASTAPQGVRSPSLLSVPALAGVAVACLAICATELLAARAEALGEPAADGQFAPRLFAEKTIGARLRAATLASDRSRAGSDPAAIGQALALWKSLFDVAPGLAGVCDGYAESLVAAGRDGEARAVLRRAIDEKLDPYGRNVNLLYARLEAGKPTEGLQCVQRALRSSRLDNELQDTLTNGEKDPAVQRFFVENLPRAREAVGAADSIPRTDLAPELLRMNAYREHRAGRYSEAIADQRRAAEYYRRLETQLDRNRRAARAEADAWFGLALMLYESNPPDFREAYAAILLAERYAVRGIRHESVARPEPDAGFVIGEVMPVEFPPQDLPLWRLSLVLHLLHGDLSYPEIRAGFTLPPAEWNPEAIAGQIVKAARQALHDLNRIPPEARAADAAQLRGLVERYGSAADRAPQGKRKP